jgi:hypothetical protein
VRGVRYKYRPSVYHPVYKLRLHVECAIKGQWPETKGTRELQYGKKPDVHL